MEDMKAKKELHKLTILVFTLAYHIEHSLLSSDSGMDSEAYLAIHLRSPSRCLGDDEEIDVSESADEMML